MLVNNCVMALRPPGAAPYGAASSMGSPYLAYQRSKFKTRLPTDRVYTRAHAWLRPQGEDRVRIGFTLFATRMIGEVVEFDFEVQGGAQVQEGDAVGWLEGFKAVSDIYAPMSGSFAGTNAELDADVSAIHRSPYAEGWIYEMVGDLPESALSPEDYAACLDGTIDRMMGEEQS